jgi:hypothetical protein
VSGACGPFERPILAYLLQAFPAYQPAPEDNVVVVTGYVAAAKFAIHVRPAYQYAVVPEGDGNNISSFEAVVLEKRRHGYAPFRLHDVVVRWGVEVCLPEELAAIAFTLVVALLLVELLLSPFVISHEVNISQTPGFVKTGSFP